MPEINRYLYHRTAKENIESILKNGLLCSKSQGWKGKGCIYLSTMPDNGFGKELLSIDAIGLQLADLSDWEYVCWDDIPPERIKLGYCKETIQLKKAS